MTTLSTPRLRLEPFADKHLDGLLAMNQRPEGMRHLGGEPESRDQVAASIVRVQQLWTTLGAGWWALIEMSSGLVAGAGCNQYCRKEAELPANLEALQGNPLKIGWRLHPDYWGQGMTTEAAKRMALFAFHSLHAQELIAVRHPDNLSPERVRDRLRMRYRGLEHWYGTTLATHVISRDEWP